MTYGLFLLVFLIVPTFVLVFFQYKHWRRHHLIAVGLICLLAFLYTTPWDNFAAYRKLWTFGKEFVWGPPLWFGYLPLEEYLFYFAEGIFTCVVIVALSRVPFLRPKNESVAE